MATAPFPIYDDLAYEDYLNNHLLPNTPFLLSSKATDHWPARSWTLDSFRIYGSQIVPVADTSRREFSEFERCERPLKEILDLWETDHPEGRSLYIKDWHLAEGYDVPDCFQDDWLATPPDFGFTYVGPAGTWTPVHRDVYASYSWSANMKGRKAWWLFPPGTEVDKLYDVRRDGEEGAIKVVQEGQVLFVPSGWYHQVVNLDFCISVNHNFFSSPTLPRIYAALEEGQQKVEESIQDVKEMIIQRLGVDGPWEAEWLDEMQKLLIMDAGWGWKGFWETVRDNVRTPPAPVNLSPPIDMRDRYIRQVIESYRKRREWIFLTNITDIVDEVITMLDKV